MAIRVLGNDGLSDDQLCNNDQAYIKKLEKQKADLVEALQWMVDNDETNEGDVPLPDRNGRTWNEINAYWIDGLNKAKKALSDASS